MSKKSRLGAFIASAVLIAGGLVGAIAAPAAAADEPGMSTFAICQYEYGGRCVTWVTTLASCHDIYHITTDKRKITACHAYINNNIVTVWP